MKMLESNLKAIFLRNSPLSLRAQKYLSFTLLVCIIEQCVISKIFVSHNPREKQKV